ncbi:hypothetical protein Q8A73_007535 [Channa argus]|nr:hypothetical protein Q8A73_007535 [Channa argus]
MRRRKGRHRQQQRQQQQQRGGGGGGGGEGGERERRSERGGDREGDRKKEELRPDANPPPAGHLLLFAAPPCVRIQPYLRSTSESKPHFLTPPPFCLFYVANLFQLSADRLHIASNAIASSPCLSLVVISLRLGGGYYYYITIIITTVPELLGFRWRLVPRRYSDAVLRTKVAFTCNRWTRPNAHFELNTRRLVVFSHRLSVLCQDEQEKASFLNAGSLREQFAVMHT